MDISTAAQQISSSSEKVAGIFEAIVKALKAGKRRKALLEALDRETGIVMARHLLRA